MYSKKGLRPPLGHTKDKSLATPLPMQCTPPYFCPYVLILMGIKFEIVICLTKNDCSLLDLPNKNVTNICECAILLHISFRFTPSSFIIQTKGFFPPDLIINICLIFLILKLNV